jgi:hypothetical protein
MSAAFEMVRTALDERGSRLTDNRQNHFLAQCPAHEDRNPSLGVDDAGDKVMLRCYAGCHTDEVVKALGLELKDLFDGDLDNQRDSMFGVLIRSYLYERTNGEPWFYVDRFYPKTFRQRLPDVEPVRDLTDRTAAKRLGLRGRAPIVYHAPKVYRAMRKGGAVVWWLDGEKDVETAERHGLVATCPPGFAKWDEHYAEFLKGASEVVMVVDQDKEKPDGSLGSGQANAILARNGLRSVGVKVRAVSPAAGKDLTDHFTAGFGVEDFTPEPTIYTRPRGLKASELEGHVFDPVKWAVEGILPAGLCILAAAPKAGKSWIALDLGLAVGAGGRALGALRARQGSALYLAREDSYRRLQSRMRLLMGGAEIPDHLEVIPSEQEWVGGEEGLANMTEWAEEVGDAALVVIDTLQRVEPELGEDSRRGAYTGNYSMMARYKQWADDHNAAVLMVHHDRKADMNTKSRDQVDPFTRISGTRGLTGAADTLWFLDTERGTGAGTLFVTGRDVAEQALEMRKVGPLWQCVSVPQGME